MADYGRTIHVRVTDEQWGYIRERSAELGCSAGSYIRHAVAAYALASDKMGDGSPEFVGVDTRSLRELTRELVIQGVNLNQIAHALNVSALAAEGAESGLTPDDRRVILDGVEEARLSLPSISEGLKKIHLDFREMLDSTLVEIPAPKKKVAGEATKCP